jgi:leucine efflux protein
MFGVADYWAFVLAVIVFLAIPGVGNLAIITSTSKGGVAGGLAATLGVIVGDQVLMWLAVAGVAAVLSANTALFGIVQYAAFFPLFVDTQRAPALATFGMMALTIAVLTFLYCVIVIFITRFAADRMRASPRVAAWLNRIAGTMLVGFGVKLAVGK